LLSALGFGLDLDRCALSGANDGLTHVSPKTGRAVRGSEAADYVDRLFSLPAFLLDPSAPLGPEDLSNALALTGYFIEQRLFGTVNKTTPIAREHVVQKLLRAAL
jgi:DNA repair protein RecO (recombination protein O)